MQWLAYLHPAGMLAVLGLGLFVLREGIRVRRARLARVAFDATRHRRLARIFAILVAVGYGSGLVSMLVLREKPALESFHGLLTSFVFAAVMLAAALGLALERGARERVRTLHLCAGALGLLAALAAAVAGMSILP